MQKIILVLLILLVAALAAASTPAVNNPAAGSPAAIRTYILPDFTLVSVITFDAVGSASSALPTELAVTGPPKRGFCRCSCGFPCATSADCGGVSCDPFITCCAKDPQGNSNEWFSGLAQSSHKYPVPAALLKANCK